MVSGSSESKKHVQVCPENAVVPALGDMTHVLMIVPLDADVKETGHVALQHRQYGSQRLEVCSMRYLHLQDHDRDDDPSTPSQNATNRSLSMRKE